MLDGVKPSSIFFIYSVWSFTTVSYLKLNNEDWRLLTDIVTVKLSKPPAFVRTVVTPKEILQRVQEGADARWGDTIEKLFLVLRNRHTHQCWRKECDCEYCRFINGRYVQAKLALHQIKKRINKIDYWVAMDWEITLMPQLVDDQLKQKARIRELKGHKRELQGNII